VHLASPIPQPDLALDLDPLNAANARRISRRLALADAVANELDALRTNVSHRT
jgi:hypothetical protein